MIDHGRHALVIGGSMGGLLAARALSGHFATVTILDRDALPDAAMPRRAVPQGRHAHGLLAGGTRALEALFPGILGDLAAAGAVPGDIATTSLWHNFGGILRTAPSGLEALYVSRPTLEAVVRRRVRALPNVTLRDRAEVLGPVADPATGRVTGVTWRTAGTEALAETLGADLVVDASGRGSRAPHWLAQLGHAAPAEETVTVDIAYTTRHFRRRPGELGGKLAIVYGANPANWRPAAMLAQEGDRWVATLGGYFGEKAPTDLDGFRAYARSLPGPELYEVIRDAEPVGEAATYGFRSSQRRRYERLPDGPAGFLVFGDAIAAFNPIYGQGMSVAARQALALRDALGRGPDGLARRFFAAASRAIDGPWGMAVGADLGHPGVLGARTPAVRFLNAYVARLFRAGHADPRVSHAFLAVANLVAPPAALFHPATLWRVLRASGPARDAAVPAMTGLAPAGLPRES